MQKDITIIKEDNTYMEVICKDDSISHFLTEFFSYESEGAKWRKNKRWDGMIRLYNKYNKKMYVGLLNVLLLFCQKNNLSYELDNLLIDKTETNELEILEWIVNDIKPTDGDGLYIEPYEHQVQAITESIKHHRCTLLSATNSGKSLITYCLVRYYQLIKEKENSSILIIVPTKMLVEQLYSDFGEYSQKSDWCVGKYCQKITGDYEKIVKKEVVISTWQSIYDRGVEFFKQFEFVVVDECHKAQSDSFKKILENCGHIRYRVGMTGTLDKSKVPKLIINGLIGRIKKIISAKEMIDEGMSTNLDIKMIMMRYKAQEAKDLHKMKLNLKREFKEQDKKIPAALLFNLEMDFIMEHKRRMEKVVGFANTLKGNTIILSNRVENHLEPMYEHALSTITDRDIYIITGSGKYATDATERELIRNKIAEDGNCIVFATYGTMSTGINIKNLHNLIFASSLKAFITICQAIGRLLRLHDSKKIANVYDMVDVLNHKKSPNFFMKHAIERYNTYISEGYKVKKFNVKI